MIILFDNVLLFFFFTKNGDWDKRYRISINPSSLMTLCCYPGKYHSFDRVFVLKTGYVYPKATATATEGVACEGYRQIKPFHAKWLWTPWSPPPTPQTLAITLSSYLIPVDSWFTVQIIDSDLFITTDYHNNIMCVYIYI